MGTTWERFDFTPACKAIHTQGAPGHPARHIECRTLCRAAGSNAMPGNLPVLYLRPEQNLIIQTCHPLHPSTVLAGTGKGAPSSNRRFRQSKLMDTTTISHLAEGKQDWLGLGGIGIQSLLYWLHASQRTEEDVLPSCASWQSICVVCLSRAAS